MGWPVPRAGHKKNVGGHGSGGLGQREGRGGSPSFLGHPRPSNIPLKDRQLPSSKALLWGARVPNPSFLPASQGEGIWFPPSNSISYDLSRNLPSWHLRCFVLGGSLQPLAWGSVPKQWSGREKPVGSCDAARMSRRMRIGHCSHDGAARSPVLAG